uniref:Uncharacterized protein n=1 Tax=Cyprinus carpio TaxID=7962 RepID=A0A8C1MIY9_CYPCA
TSFIWDKAKPRLSLFVSGLYKKSGRLVLLGLGNSLCLPLTASEVLRIAGRIHTSLSVSARGEWRKLLPAVNGIVFLVDCADYARLPESKTELDVSFILSPDTSAFVTHSWCASEHEAHVC